MNKSNAQFYYKNKYDEEKRLVETVRDEKSAHAQTNAKLQTKLLSLEGKITGYSTEVVNLSSFLLDVQARYDKKCTENVGLIARHKQEMVTQQKNFESRLDRARSQHASDIAVWRVGSDGVKKLNR